MRVRPPLLFSRIIYLLLLSLIIAHFVLPQPVAAQTSSATSSGVLRPLDISYRSEPLNLTLSPVFLNLATDPGVPEKTEIMIRNNSTAPEQLEITLGSFEADETGQRPRLLEADPNEEFLSWLSFSEKTFVVNPGEWKTIHVTFSPPKHAALSYYYTLMVSRTAERKIPGETTVVGKPAILVLTTVDSPSARRELTLSSFSARRSWLEFLPQTFSLKIKNTGNVHVSPSGTIFIDGQGKKDIAVININPNRSTILPNSERNFEVEWSDGFPQYVAKTANGADVQSDDGKQEVELKYDFSKADRLRWGRYTAHLLMVYDNGERDVPIESSITFWVIPWRFILGVIAIPTVPALIVFLIMRSMMRRRQF